MAITLDDFYPNNDSSSIAKAIAKSGKPKGGKKKREVKEEYPYSENEESGPNPFKGLR